MKIPIKAALILSVFFSMLAIPSVFSQAFKGTPTGENSSKEINFIVHVRGVYDSKISLIPLVGRKALAAITVEEGVKNGSAATLKVPTENLPGEFVLRFDYKEESSSTPYPSEKRMLIGFQDLELWVNPPYCNNSDSSYFQKGELENSVFKSFITECNKQLKVIGLLQQFLLFYDDNTSDFYIEGIYEYEKRRGELNQWVEGQRTQYEQLFASRKFNFQKIPEISWDDPEEKRKQSIVDHYFDEIDFSDPLITKTTDITEWMDNYVNSYGEMATSIPLRDSLFTLAGQRAIEKAKIGDPIVYGWMVDYFFDGYESNGIDDGIKMLQPYLDDPNCLTKKKLAIQKRLEGLNTLIPGSVIPDFTLSDEEGNSIMFHDYPVNKPYKLILFWGADCLHCKDLVDDLYPWYQKSENKRNVEVFAISLDDTEEEKEVWIEAKASMPEWKHIPTEGGVNSVEANICYVLSTPMMFLIDSHSHQIVSIPQSIDQLNQSLNK